MSTVSSLFLYIIVIVIVIALLLWAVWLLNKIARDRYHNRFVTPMLLPGQTSLTLADWEAISPPGLDGVMMCNGTAPLVGLPDQAQLSLKSKDQSAIVDFTKNVKFQFSPIYEPLPIDIIQKLLKFFGISSSSIAEMRKSDGDTDSSLMNDGFLSGQDVLLEFGMQAGSVSGAKEKPSAERTSAAGSKYFAVAFNIDPTITRVHEIDKCPDDCVSNCNRKNYYSSKEKNIRVTVSVSKGSVKANPGSNVNTGGSVTVEISNPEGKKKYLSIGGRAQNANTYSLTGTWNAS